jgi:hypothetical protein
MAISVSVVSTDNATSTQLAELIHDAQFTTACTTPDALPSELPGLFILSLPGIDTPEEQLIEKLRAYDATAAIPIVIVSKLPMIDLQSVPYASDWTIAIVEDPVDPQVLVDTMNFLLNPEG